ncbi:hypothetical protein [Helicobacter mustelae]|uniref:Uncharacterized protein n=1 Tax=Helicobacter mustelae (strain ATCC 43772 / CCUG 25715 / CIP 103759 / LMG 18044 / NCTC 12198 / R85-136P) TaxID=679897 RepID=D3UH61_HELM1|nr:hypothetical protein [Helicobacter mustelae]CBG39833.1 Putative hypothetical protein [Helicobacter mustelae 12198]
MQNASKIKSNQGDFSVHGKILKYSAASGIGLIVNHSKKIFEFRKDSWRDSKHLPVPGMLVEFRHNTNGYVTHAKASVYQGFSEDFHIQEIDFWKTDTDEELANKEYEFKADIIEKIFKQTNFFTIQDIPLDVSIEKCIEKYFFQENNAINLIAKEFPNTQEPLLDYFQMKRFLHKAIDMLIFTDKNITMDVFLERMQALNKLNHFYDLFMQNDKIDLSKLFEEHFLEDQLFYQASVHAISGLNDKISQLQSSIKAHIAEMKSIYAKIGARNTKNLKALEHRLKSLKQQISKADEEARPLDECLKRLQSITEVFRQRYVLGFQKEFKQARLILIKKITKMLDICATDLDNFIWKLAMQSTPVHNTFFNKNISGSYCAMTFLWMYLQNLDKEKLNANDKSAYDNYLRYKQKYEKTSLIYINNPKLESALKIKIMSESKCNATIIAKTNADFFSLIQSMSFTNIYLDSNPLTPITTLIEDIKKSSKNKDTPIFTIPSKKE